MSLTSNFQSLLIHGGSEPESVTPVFLEEDSRLGGATWDTLTRIYHLAVADLTPELLATMFPTGGQLPDRAFWLTSATPTRKAPGYWLIAAEFKGWASEKPAKVTVGATVSQQSGKNVSAPLPGGGFAVYANVQTLEASPSVAVTYFVLNTATASTGAVGMAMTPAVANLAVSASVWTSLPIFTYHYPNGWVLMAREQDRLEGTAVAMVTDRYQYIRDKSPSSS